MRTEWFITAALTVALFTACGPTSRPSEPPAGTGEASRAAPEEAEEARSAPKAPARTSASEKGKRNTEDDEHCDEGRKAYDFDGPSDARDADCHILRVHFSARDPETKEVRDGERVVYCCP